MVAAALGCAGAGGTVDLGSNVIWAAGHESGDLGEWTADGKGYLITTAAGAMATVAAGSAHRGGQALLLSIPAAGADAGAGLWRESAAAEAFYSAWYYLPHPYQTTSHLTIMTFQAPGQRDDVLQAREKVDLALRTLPGGEIVLYVFDHRSEYLQFPLAVPPAQVPVAAWFHLEVMYRNATDPSGRLLVWLDGRPVYEIGGRPTGTGPVIEWGLFCAGETIAPAPVEIYADDAVISLSRVTPSGRAD